MLKKYIGPPPKKCDLCENTITTDFVDGRLRENDAWATMCMVCHRELGCGVGLGNGQHYHRDENGEFVKIA